jgi:hypothetical protein
MAMSAAGTAAGLTTQLGGAPSPLTLESDEERKKRLLAQQQSQASIMRNLRNVSGLSPAGAALFSLSGA